MEHRTPESSGDRSAHHMELDADYAEIVHREGSYEPADVPVEPGPSTGESNHRNNGQRRDRLSKIMNTRVVRLDGDLPAPEEREEGVVYYTLRRIK